MKKLCFQTEAKKRFYPHSPLLPKQPVLRNCLADAAVYASLICKFHFRLSGMNIDVYLVIIHADIQQDEWIFSDGSLFLCSLVHCGIKNFIADTAIIDKKSLLFSVWPQNIFISYKADNLNSV